MQKRVLVMVVLLALLVTAAVVVADTEQAGPVVRAAQTVETVTYCSMPGLAINDMTTITDTMTVTEEGTVLDVNFYVDVSHTWISDIDMDLINNTAMLGTPVWYDQCLGGLDDFSIWFDDEAGPLDCDGRIGGTFAPPDGSLAIFDGEDVAGDWMIQIYDDAGGDQGTLNEWCVEIEYEVAAVEEEEEEEAAAPAVFQQWDPGDARLNPDPAMEVAIYCVTNGIDLWGFSDNHFGYVSVDEFAAAPATDDAPFWTSSDGTVRVYHLSNDWWGVQKDQVRGDTTETYEFAWDGCPLTDSITAVYDAAGNLLVLETGP